MHAGMSLNLLRYSLYVKNNLIESKVSKNKCIELLVFKIEMKS